MPTDVAGEPIDDLMARLERERLEADRRYNETLTAVDRALQQVSAPALLASEVDAARLVDLNTSWDLLPNGPPAADRSMKGRLRAFVWRLIGPPIERQRQFNAALVDHLNRNTRVTADLVAAHRALSDAWRQQLAELVRFESLLVQYLQTITAYVDTKDRRLGTSDLRERIALVEQRLLGLKRELEERENTGQSSRSRAGVPSGDVVASTAFAANVDAPTYLQFEDRFRGTREEIRRRSEDYVAIFEGATNVVDIGCGRGEFLEMLAARGINARGVDANAAMVAVCRSRNLAAEQADALSFLTEQADGSVGGLIALQVVEHFEPSYLLRFLETAFHKMRQGAPLVLETINPACWLAFFECYLRDLTHQRPLHPETLKYLVQSSGFSDVDVRMRQPARAEDRLARVTLGAKGDAAAMEPAVLGLIAAVNAHADALNARLFSSMDYAVIARR